jgi:hypothetical protein
MECCNGTKKNSVAVHLGNVIGCHLVDEALRICESSSGGGSGTDQE